MKHLRSLSQAWTNPRKWNKQGLIDEATTDEAQSLLPQLIDEKLDRELAVIHSALNEKVLECSPAVEKLTYNHFNSSDDWTHRRLLNIFWKLGYTIEVDYAARPIDQLVDVLQVTSDKTIGVWPDFIYLGMIAGVIVEGLEIKPDANADFTVTEQLGYHGHASLTALQAFWSKCRPTGQAANCSTPESRFVSSGSHLAKSDEIDHQRRIDANCKPAMNALCVSLQFRGSHILLEIPMVKLEQQETFTNSIYLSELVEYGMFHHCQRKNDHADDVLDSEKSQAGRWGRRITPDELGFSHTLANGEPGCLCKTLLGPNTPLQRYCQPHIRTSRKNGRFARVLLGFSRWLATSK